MTTPYIGEIRIFGGNFAPNGWAFCDGSLLSIPEHDALFSLIGTTYGGDGENTFALPDLRGRLPVHQGTGPDGANYVIGQQGGAETVTLTADQAPEHSHTMVGSGDIGNQTSPVGHVLARSNTLDAYSNRPPNLQMRAASTTPVGGGQPHENMQPYLPISFIIALFGVYPTQT
jgi:microcystin-dependent protein